MWALVYYLQADGRHEQASRLLLPGEAGHPDEEELPYLAAMIHGRLRLRQPGSDLVDRVYGHGPLLLSVDRVRQEDGAGHASWHFVVHEAYAWAAGGGRQRLRGKVSPVGLHAVYRLSSAERVIILMQVIFEKLESDLLLSLARNS